MKSIFDLKGNELQRAFNKLGLETDGTDWDADENDRQDAELDIEANQY